MSCVQNAYVFLIGKMNLLCTARLFYLRNDDKRCICNSIRGAVLCKHMSTFPASILPIPFIDMPPPLGAGGIMFSGCPSVRPSGESWNNLFSPVHGSVVPSDQPWPLCGMSVRPSVCPSGEVSGHLPENAWREWSEILHVDVSWARSELIRLWSWSVDFPPFDELWLSEIGQNWDFRAFSGERMVGVT